MSNSLDPDQSRRFVKSHLAKSCKTLSESILRRNEMLKKRTRFVVYVAVMHKLAQLMFNGIIK